MINLAAFLKQKKKHGENSTIQMLAYGMKQATRTRCTVLARLSEHQLSKYLSYQLNKRAAICAAWYGKAPKFECSHLCEGADTGTCALHKDTTLLYCMHVAHWDADCCCCVDKTCFRFVHIVELAEPTAWFVLSEQVGLSKHVVETTCPSVWITEVGL